MKRNKFQVDESEESDVENLRTLFRAARAVMQYQEVRLISNKKS